MEWIAISQKRFVQPTWGPDETPERESAISRRTALVNETKSIASTNREKKGGAGWGRERKFCSKKRKKVTVPGTVGGEEKRMVPFFKNVWH